VHMCTEVQIVHTAGLIRADCCQKRSHVTAMYCDGSLIKNKIAVVCRPCELYV
jgi:hypothetical protein